MASDYGDEAGEKLFDWMLRMGQDASQDAIRASAERLKNAIRNLRGQIDEPLAEAEHESASIDGHDHLIFKVEDAPEVDEAFKELERDADAACERAVKERGRDLSAERDAEPLEQKAAAAHEASHAYQAASKTEHEMERIEVKAR